MSQTTQKELRNFGLLFGIVFTGIGLYQLYADTAETARLVLWILGALFLIAGATVPAALKPLHAGWMKFAFVLGWINTRIIITLIFYLVMTPIGFIMRIIKGDLLAEKLDKNKSSYWDAIEPVESVKEHCERQF